MTPATGTQHHYHLTVTWTGNDGSGTTSYRTYRRDHEVAVPGLPPIAGSSDPAFRGDPARWNPEQLLVASVAQCHLLWYLHLASAAGISVVEYLDHPEGTMTEQPDGAGQFTQITLHPHVTITDRSQLALAESLHERVGDVCFIARSVNFPIHHSPITTARP